MAKEYISEKQCMLLLIGSVIGIALMLVPSTTALLAKQDAWLAPWLGAVPGLGLLGLMISLNKMYPGQSLVQYCLSILGWPGHFVVFVMLWYFWYLGALVLQDIVSFVTSIMLFETPLAAVYFFTILLCAYALKLGIETIARAFSIVIPLALIFILMIQGFSLPLGDYENLLPILSSGVFPLVHASLDFTAFPVVEGLLLFSMIIYHVKDSSKLGTRLSTGFLLSVFILFLVIVRALLVLGPERASRNIYASVAAINAMPGGGLLLAFMTLDWFIFSLCELILCYYAFVTGVSHWAKLADYKPLILPAGALITVQGIYMFDNVIESATFSTTIWPAYAIPIGFGIPLLLWVIAVIKNNFS